MAITSILGRAELRLIRILVRFIKNMDIFSE